MLQLASRIPPLTIGPSHDRLGLLHHAVRMIVVIGLAVRQVRCVATLLLLGNWAVLMGNQNGLQIQNFFSHLLDLCIKSVVLIAKQFHFRLEVSKPLLLPLSTLQSSNPVEN